MIGFSPTGLELTITGQSDLVLSHQIRITCQHEAQPEPKPKSACKLARWTERSRAREGQRDEGHAENPQLARKTGLRESKGVLPDEHGEAIFKNSVFVLGHWE